MVQFFCLKRAKKANSGWPPNTYSKRKYFGKLIFFQNAVKNSECPVNFALFSSADYSENKFWHLPFLKNCQKYALWARIMIFTLNYWAFVHLNKYVKISNNSEIMVSLKALCISGRLSQTMPKSPCFSNNIVL